MGSTVPEFADAIVSAGIAAGRMVGAVLVAGAVLAQAAPDGGKLSGEVPKRVAPKREVPQRRRQTEGDDQNLCPGADLFPAIGSVTEATDSACCSWVYRSYGLRLPDAGGSVFANSQARSRIIGLQEVSEWITNRNVQAGLERARFPGVEERHWRLKAEVQGCWHQPECDDRAVPVPRPGSVMWRSVGIHRLAVQPSS